MEEDKITVTAVEKQSYEDHNPRLYLALALQCKASALVTVKNTEANNGPKAWRGLNSAYDNSTKGRQRVRMQYLLQPKRSESVLQTTESVERWECDVREYEQRFGKNLGEDVKIAGHRRTLPLVTPYPWTSPCWAKAKAKRRAKAKAKTTQKRLSILRDTDFSAKHGDT